MQQAKWTELIIAGVIGAVVPALGAGAFIVSLRSDVDNLQTTLNARAQIAVMTAVAKELGKHENFQSMKTKTDEAEAAIKRATKLAIITEYRANILSGQTDFLRGKLDVIETQANIAIGSISEGLNVAIADKKFQDAVVAKVKIPTGAVVAFDLEVKCPDNWQEFTTAEKRVIVGATAVERDTQRDYELGRLGGSNTYDPELSGIEPLKFKYSFARSGAGTDRLPVLVPDIEIENNLIPSGLDNYDVPLTASESDARSAEDSLPPYIALRYCKKI